MSEESNTVVQKKEDPKIESITVVQKKEDPKIESITVVQKEKNLKRVEGGKKLAAFNKAAKEKMATKYKSTDSNEQNYEDALIPFIVGAGVTFGFAYFYFTYKPDKKAASAEEVVSVNENTVPQNPPKPTGKTKLICFDN